ncbi:LacI family DNA-binding transcriptional regulator [Pseudonocardia acaciae]|uniref:LacI family DNA-binding transcriptional regulator n=1 Tax=Pseudonocardia acaciae TaxID=551276 RepID=UPI00048E5A2D|nr:LacI family DNA-binding transcriptional regulator [Pseudonocardia acaciae]
MPRNKAAVSIRDVAAAAGVSVATVSRVLSPASADIVVREETRDRVVRAINELGYRPNDLARALLQQRTSTIGLVLPDISNPYYPPLVRGVEDAASQLGYRVVLCNTDRDPAKTAAYLDTLVKARVDGVIVAGGNLSELPGHPRVFETYRTKLVMVGRHGLAHPSVRVDNTAATEDATAHLIGLGHRGIAFLGGPEGSSTAQDRLLGHRRAMAAAALPTAERVAGFDEHGGYDAARSLLTGTPPTALLCANDRMAFGAYAALADAGLAVPADVSVVGFDDVPMASYVRPTLTTVAVPTYELGRAAMRLLQDALDGSAATEPVLLPTRLVHRASCARLA